MKRSLFICLILLAGTGTFAQSSTNSVAYTRSEASDRFKKYVGETIGPTALLGTMLSAGIKQIRNRPAEWGKTSEGFGKRVGDSFGRRLVKNAITYGLDEAFRVDSNYYKSQSRSFKAKFSNAVISSFTARNRDGKRVPGIPRLVGTYTAAIIANETWMPNRFSYKDGLRDGTISVGTNIGINLIREFILK